MTLVDDIVYTQAIVNNLAVYSVELQHYLSAKAVEGGMRCCFSGHTGSRDTTFQRWLQQRMLSTLFSECKNESFVVGL